jgi:hypothetical protein
MMEALDSSETSVLTRVTRRKLPEDAIINVLNASFFQFYTPHKMFPSTTKMYLRTPGVRVPQVEDY